MTKTTCPDCAGYAVHETKCAGQATLANALATTKGHLAEAIASADRCPHCGSTEGTWFSREWPGNYRCKSCGNDVDRSVTAEQEQ